jgi:hypothetical protein
MYALLSIAGIVLVILALWRLSKIFTINAISVLVIFVLGILLARFWPVFIGCLAVAFSLFLWWLIFRFIKECLTEPHEKKQSYNTNYMNYIIFLLLSFLTILGLIFVKHL